MDFIYISIILKILTGSKNVLIWELQSRRVSKIFKKAEKALEKDVVHCINLCDIFTLSSVIIKIIISEYVKILGLIITKVFLQISDFSRFDMVLFT